MKTVDTIKKKYGEFRFKSFVKKDSRRVHACNIEEAEEIGIIFNATYPINFEIIRELTKDLNKKDISVTTMGYVDSDVLIDHYLIRKGFDFFTHKDLNWYSKPGGEKVEAFISKEFDILINLSLEKFLPIDFVLAESRAKFKVGKLFDDHALMDMMIDTTKEVEKINALRAEVREEKIENGEPVPEDEGLDANALYEIQLNYLIHQVMYYLQMIKATDA